MKRDFVTKKLEYKSLIQNKRFETNKQKNINDVKLELKKKHRRKHRKEQTREEGKEEI